MKKWLTFSGSNSHTNLMAELRCEPEDWRNYMRMDEDTYRSLLEMVGPLIQQEDTNTRQAILPHERLSATLRFLATGRTLKDLSYSVRIGSSTLTNIIPETCNAIFHVLRDKDVKERYVCFLRFFFHIVRPQPFLGQVRLGLILNLT